MLVDIVILPPAKLREKLGKQITKATKGYPHIFVVDNKKFIPHVSLFHLRSSRDRLSRIFAIVQDIIKDYKLKSLKLTQFDVGEEQGRSWVGIGLSNSKGLIQLHKAIVDGSKDLRTSMMPFTSKRKATKLE